MSTWDLPRSMMAVGAVGGLAAVALFALATEPAAVVKDPTSALQPPTSAPATVPAIAPADAGPFPVEYNVLLARSMFARGHPSVAATGPATRPVSPEQGLVLRGVASQGPVRTALLEDLSTHATRQLHIGDDVIGGKVVAISMDGLDRTLGPRMLHVRVGQPIDGSPMPPPPGGAAADVIVTARPGSTTQPTFASDGSAPFLPAPGGTPAGTPVQATLRITETK